MSDAVRILSGLRIAVLTGAGVSTDSGIPDYRGQGKVRVNPMTFAQYVGSEESRKRYWAGSHLGWRRFTEATPNAGHRALAHLENFGVVNGVITQNVDGLHRKAGSARVIELHGTLNEFLCLKCSQKFARESIAHTLTEANPWLAHPAEVVLNPDGDVDTKRFADFSIPSCSNCGGMLKPDVVFFGELVPRQRFHAAFDIVHEAEALMIVGSSLEVNSGIRLLDRAVKQGSPVVIINRGPSKGDSRAAVRLEAGASEILTQLAKRLPTFPKREGVKQ